MHSQRIHIWLLIMLVGVTTANDAKACPRTGWELDDTYGSDCVTVNRVGTTSFEIVNDCAESLTLSFSGCTTCNVPESIDAGDVALAGFAEYPTESTTLYVSWEAAGISGGTSLGFTASECPDGAGCSAVPPRPSGLQVGCLVLPILAVFVRRRRVRRS